MKVLCCFLALFGLLGFASDKELDDKEDAIYSRARRLHIDRADIRQQIKEIEEDCDDEDDDEDYYDCLCMRLNSLLRSLPRRQQRNADENQTLTGKIASLYVYKNTSTLGGGPFSIFNGRIEFTLPDGISIYLASMGEVTETKTKDGSVATITLGNIPARQVRPVLVIFEITKPGNFEIVAQAKSELFDPNPSNDTRRLFVAATEPQKQLAYPWISNNQQFESVLVANNYGPEEALVELHAFRNEGDGEAVVMTIPPYGFLKKKASELFPALGDGSGYMVFLRSDQSTIAGNWVTNNLTTPSGASPSQGVAVDVPFDDFSMKERSGKDILFGYLPVSPAFFSAPVLLNLGSDAADVTLTYFNQAGEALLSDATTLQGMSNYRPFASLANSALPAGSTDVYLRAQSSSERVTGVGFVFNSANEPSIANAVGLNPAKSFDRLLLPWVSKNAQFESIVNINNLGTTPLSVNLTATRGNGETMTVTELITSQGFMNRTAGSLFAGLGDGSGFSVMIQAENGGKLNAQANVVTYNLTTASKTSPSFGNAVAYTQSGPSPNPEDAFGKAICFGFLPVTNDLISSPVIVNLSQAAANVTLYFFDETGQLVLKDDQTLQNLAPLQPFAAVANNLIPAGSNDVYLVAVSDQPITGLSFVFNTSAEPSIGNVSRVDFTPPN